MLANLINEEFVNRLDGVGVVGPHRDSRPVSGIFGDVMYRRTHRAHHRRPRWLFTMCLEWRVEAARREVDRNPLQMVTYRAQILVV